MQANIQAFELIQKHYNDEITDIFSWLGTWAIQPKREAWNDYIKFLKNQFSQKTILDKYNIGISLNPQYRSKKTVKEIFGLDFSKKTLLITFDDGPHRKYTPKILTILKKYNIKSVFFHVGEHLGDIDAVNKISLSKAADISK